MAGERRKVRRSEAEALVAEWRASGESLPAWCGLRGLDGRSLRYWAERLSERVPELRVVEMSAPRPASSRAGIRLRVEDMTITVAETFSEDTLVRVLRAVRAC